MNTTSKRTYRSVLRERQANQTRRRILDATENLLLSRGYAKTTVDAIAAAAEVSPQTVYTVFKNKRAIMSELLERGIFEELDPLLEQVLSIEDTREALKLAVTLLGQVRGREAPQYDLLRSAGILSPELARIRRNSDQHQQRIQEEHTIILLRNARLRAGLTMKEAVDIFWCLTGRDIYQTLVLERGWTVAAYTAWVYATLEHALLEEADGALPPAAR